MPAILATTPEDVKSRVARGVDAIP